MGYFEFLYDSGIIWLPLNILQKCISSKSQKRKWLIAFILINTIQSPCTLKSNICHSNKSSIHHHFFIQIPILCLGTFWSIILTKPMFWLEQWNWFGCCSWIYFLWTLLQRRTNFCYVGKIQKKLCKTHCCSSNQPRKLHSVFAWCVLRYLKWPRSFFLQLFF